MALERTEETKQGGEVLAHGYGWMDGFGGSEGMIRFGDILAVVDENCPDIDENEEFFRQQLRLKNHSFFPFQAFQLGLLGEFCS